SGRAEIGTAGSDDFEFKVSPNGTDFLQGIVIDERTGDVTFPNTVLPPKPEALTAPHSLLLTAADRFLALGTGDKGKVTVNQIAASAISDRTAHVFLGGLESQSGFFHFCVRGETAGRETIFHAGYKSNGQPRLIYGAGGRQGSNTLRLGPGGFVTLYAAADDFYIAGGFEPDEVVIFNETGTTKQTRFVRRGDGKWDAFIRNYPLDADGQTNVAFNIPTTVIGANQDTDYVIAGLVQRVPFGGLPATPRATPTVVLQRTGDVVLQHQTNLTGATVNLHVVDLNLVKS
ncbi:MAG: hypothetical protein AAFO79_09215, partial [Pseudomonadota bacterium]